MTSLLLIGCGKMGGALFSRWRGNYDCTVIDPAQPGGYKNLESLPQDVQPDIVVFAVKPQQLAELLPAYKKRFAATPLYISIAAGKSLSFFADHLGADAKVVRAMPNTPATIGQGMTVLCASPSLAKADVEMATFLMQAAGKVEWADESKMDAVTALSGSGPAYTFLFLDALTKAGVAAGLPEAQAKQLALETVSGSCALAQQSSESLEQLRQNVTSPGGTTEAALAILTRDNALEKLIAEAVRAAKNRSEELK